MELLIKSKFSSLSELRSWCKVDEGISVQLDRGIPVYGAEEVITGRVIVAYEKQEGLQGESNSAMQKN